MRLLDLYCGAGGAAVGYHQAGFTEIVGVDINPQPNYPFKFMRADALQPPVRLEEFDLIHASPPCQDYSRAMRHLSHPQPRLIDPTRQMLDGLPHVIENVVGAPLTVADSLFGEYGTVLCGTSFGLRVQRHRLFESSIPLPRLACSHAGPAMNPHNQAGRDRIYAEFGRGDPEIHWRREMGVEWMGKYEGREAIPPAYTKFIGEQFLAQVAAH